jgi:hypothetical protein
MLYTQSIRCTDFRNSAKQDNILCSGGTSQEGGEWS